MDDAPRPAAAADLPAVHELVAAADLPLEGLPDAWQVWVIGPPARPLAAVALERHPSATSPGGVVFLLRSLVVAPTAQGRGLGARLVRHALDAADRDVRQDGAAAAAAVALLTQTADDYVARFGFAPVQREHLPPELAASAEFAGACPASARAYRRG